jgi:hypothetical protein
MAKQRPLGVAGTVGVRVGAASFHNSETVMVTATVAVETGYRTLERMTLAGIGHGYNRLVDASPPRPRGTMLNRSNNTVCGLSATPLNRWPLGNKRVFNRFSDGVSQQCPNKVTQNDFDLIDSA